MTSSATPAFGEADLSNCEREQIQYAGSIQPHGALILLDESGSCILQASANAAAFLNIDGDLIGRDLASLPGTMAARLRAHLGEPLHRRAVAVRGRIGEPLVDVDALIHRPPDGGVIVEFEPAGAPIDFGTDLRDVMQSIVDAQTLRALCDTTAAIVERLTGYDRVMVYRFDELGHGEIFAERRRAHQEAFLGNRYPASDIPQIARRLYLENRVRLLVDVAYAPVPLVPRLSPLTGRDLDMSMCGLRSMSPIHLQYLKNMGVKATLVVSIVVGGELWGLIACHHDSPRFVPFELRSLCDIIAELVATRIPALQSVVQTQSELVVRRLEQRMVEAIGRDGDWRSALFDGSKVLLQSLNASGVALLYEGEVRSSGEVPSTPQIRQLAAWLDARAKEPVTAVTAIGREAAPFAALLPVCAGFLATPISANPGEYLIWFRPERVHTVTWGGDPTKPVIVGTDPRQLSPRLSFAQWHQVVEGTCDPWTPADRTTARLVGGTISDMALQFRSVRLLIAQDQLDSLSRQVRASAQPMIVAASSGRILLVNEAFAALLQPGQPSMQRLDDLPAHLEEPLSARRQIELLLRDDTPWRGEVVLASLGGTARPFVVRGEAVYASLDRKLGYILTFEPTSDRKIAEAARRQFQDGMIDRRLLRPARLDLGGDRDYQDALTTVIENAQLAALEVTYGIDAGEMPRILESLRTSVARTADLIEHLIWHASGVEGERR